LRFLNPLRYHTVENYLRLRKILDQITEENGVLALTFAADAKETRSRPVGWYGNEGHYLISSSYLAACFFSMAARIRRSLPFITLNEKDDTEVLNLIRRVSLGYLDELGVFYVIQNSIGDLMWNGERIISFSEFCEKLKSPDGIWFDRLINYYIDLGHGNRKDGVEKAVQAMSALAEFLDKQIGGGSYLRSIET